MPVVYIVEFSEKGQRKQENVELGHPEQSQDAAEDSIRRLWGAALPERTDVKIVNVAGAGVVQRIPMPPATAEPGKGDAAYIKQKLKESGDI